MIGSKEESTAFAARTLRSCARTSLSASMVLSISCSASTWGRSIIVAITSGSIPSSGAVAATPFEIDHPSSSGTCDFCRVLRNPWGRLLVDVAGSLGTASVRRASPLLAAACSFVAVSLASALGNCAGDLIVAMGTLRASDAFKVRSGDEFGEPPRRRLVSRASGSSSPNGFKSLFARLPARSYLTYIGATRKEVCSWKMTKQKRRLTTSPASRILHGSSNP